MFSLGLFFYTLTDPVINSRGKGGKYGITDIGQEGIDNFFAYHKCNPWCISWWRPSTAKKIFEPVQGTTLKRIATGELFGTKRLETIVEHEEDPLQIAPFGV